MNMLYLIREKKKGPNPTHTQCECVCVSVCDTKPKPSIRLSPKKGGFLFFLVWNRVCKNSNLRACVRVFVYMSDAEKIENKKNTSPALNRKP